MIELNLGCGNEIHEAAYNLDKKDFGQEYIRDVDKECLPFCDNSIDKVFCKHAFEHFRESRWVLDEILRVLRDDGVAEIIVPHYQGKGAYQIGHEKYFSEKAFDGIAGWKKERVICNRTRDIHFTLRPNKSPKEHNHDLKVDLGCGKAKEKGFIGIDIGDYGQEIQCDLRKGIPLCGESVSEMRTYAFLEHLQPEEVMYMMFEIWRVLKPNKTVDILVPYGGNNTSFKDPTHKSFWREETFLYFTGEKPAHYDLMNGKLFEPLKSENNDNETLEAKLKKIC